MGRRIDLSTVSPEKAEQLLRQREQKRREYERRKDVILARSREWRKKHPDREREQLRNWASANPDRKAANTRASYERHRERRLAEAARRYEELADSVVRSTVAHGRKSFGLSSKDVPDEALPLFRIQLLIKRELRKQKAAS